ncbi:MAG: glycosyltransferase [Bacteroidia bacterium]|nr:glycosyltransferase [Bacteroidia bacterium]
MISLIGISYFLILTYAVLILYYASQWKKLKSYKNVEINETVSIILAVRNEEIVIQQTLAGLVSQNYSKDKFEIIVVDDQSNDGTVEQINEFINKHNAPNVALLRILPTDDDYGKKIAIQKGIEKAKGNIIVTTDADCTYSKNWLGSLVSPFADSKINMVMGKVELEKGEGSFQLFQHIEFATLIGLTAAAAQLNKPILCNGANLAYRKKIYEELGSYNIQEEGFSGDDVFLMQKIQERYPGSLVFNKTDEALVSTKGKENKDEFIQQRKRWISKVSKYESNKVQYLGVFIFAVNVALLYSILYSIFYFNPVPVIIVWLSKSIVDFLFIRNVLNKFNKWSLFKSIFSFEGKYASYLFRLLIFSKDKLEWKGRKI